MNYASHEYELETELLEGEAEGEGEFEFEFEHHEAGHHEAEHHEFEHHEAPHHEFELHEFEHHEAGHHEAEQHEYEQHEQEGERELELATELLSISNEQELNHFLGRFFRNVGGAARSILASPAGQQLRGLLRRSIKAGLPLAGRAVGGYFGGASGADIGGQVGNVASRIFGLELEGMSGEDQELEVARRYVRLADEAVQRLADAPSSGNPRQLAASALAAAARRHAPGLLARSAGSLTTNGQPLRRRRRSGRWYLDASNNIVVVL